jgi:hypothetical protein
MHHTPWKKFYFSKPPMLDNWHQAHVAVQLISAWPKTRHTCNDPALPHAGKPSGPHLHRRDKCDFGRVAVLAADCCAAAKAQSASRMFLLRHIHFAAPALEDVLRMFGEILLRLHLCAHGAFRGGREILRRQALLHACLGVGGKAVYEDEHDHGVFPQKMFFARFVPLRYAPGGAACKT